MTESVGAGDQPRVGATRGHPAIWRILAVLSWTLLASLACFHSWSIVKEADWILGDDVIFTSSVAADQWFGLHMLVRTGDSRFFPLAFQEFNLLKGSGDAPHLYYMLMWVKYLLTLAVMLATCGVMIRSIVDQAGKEAAPGACGAIKMRLWTLAAAGIAVLYLLNPRLHLMFGHVIYPESMLMVWLALFALLGFLAAATDRTGCHLAALVCGAALIFYKEPAFAFILPAALLPLAASWRSVSKRYKLFAAGLLAVTAGYLLLYYFLVFAHRSGTSYADIYYQEHDRFDLAFLTLFLNPKTIYPVMLGVGLWRFAVIIRRKWRREPIDMRLLFIDSLLFGGLLYMAAFVALKMPDIRYVPPSNVFFALACFYYAGLAVQARLTRAPVPEDAASGSRSGRLIWLWGVPVAAVLLVLWLLPRFNDQVAGFNDLHGMQRTWAPNLSRVASVNGRYPVVFVHPDPAPHDDAIPHEEILHPYFVKGARACMELNQPHVSVRFSYLDLDDALETDRLVGGEVPVVKALPDDGRYFLCVPHDAENFRQDMQDRFGLAVEKVSDFGFAVQYHREFWATEKTAEELRALGAFPPASGMSPRP